MLVSAAYAQHKPVRGYLGHAQRRMLAFAGMTIQPYGVPAHAGTRQHGVKRTIYPYSDALYIH
jgi:hypothetical protein